MNDVDEQKRPRVLLVDLSGIFWRAWHSNGENEVSSARRRSREMIDRIVAGDYSQLVAICCDRGRSFRKDIEPEYKAKRPDKDLQVMGELHELEQDLTTAGYLLWGADTFEADDIIATATDMAVEAGHEVTIASADKDLLQLLAIEGVDVFRVHTWKRVTRGDFIDAFGIPPYLFGDWLALVGDKSDNVIGVPSVGDKTASAMLRAFPGLSYVLEAAGAGTLEKTTGVKPGQAKAVAQHADAARHARTLVELRRDAPVYFDQIYADSGARQKPIKSKEIDMETGDSKLGGGEQAGPAVAAHAAAQGVGIRATEPAVTPENAPVAHSAGEPSPVTAQQTKEKGTALVPMVAAEVVPARFEMGLEPANLAIAWNLADILWESRLYSKYPNRGAIMAVIGRARELGYGAYVAPDLFHFFENKLAVHATFMRELAEKNPSCEWIMPAPGKLSAESATWRTKHRKHPEPFEHTYTIQDAVNAGLCRAEIIPRDWNAKDGKDHRGNWDKRRPEMLSKTACSQLIGMIYPGSRLGLYSVAELGGDED